MKRKLGLLFLALFLMLSGCQKTSIMQTNAPEKSTILLGYSQLGSESGWRDGITQSIHDAAERYDITLHFENAEQKQSKQIDAIRSFIAYQVDVIAFSPIVETGWDVVLTEAKTAGIPVLLVDRRIVTDDETLYTSFIGADFVEEGRKAARFLIEKTEKMDNVRVVEISGTTDATPAKDRYLGFQEVLGDDPKFEIIDSLDGDFLRSKGKECMKELLEKHDDIDVLFSHNDSMTIGAVEAIEAFGLRPGEDIIIISFDGEQQAVDLLKEGKINCVVECTPMLGDIVMELTQKLAEGESIDRVYYSTEEVFSEFSENLQSLPQRGY